jgi:hypothetical protein
MKKMNKEHKQCVQESNNKLVKTHNCKKETPLYRNGWRFLDLECHPTNENFKSTAIECECGSSKSQRESNHLDLLEWKKRNSEGEIFQINSSNEIDISKIRKNIFENKKMPLAPKKFPRFRGMSL